MKQINIKDWGRYLYYQIFNFKAFKWGILNIARQYARKQVKRRERVLRGIFEIEKSAMIRGFENKLNLISREQQKEKRHVFSSDTRHPILYIPINEQISLNPHFPHHGAAKVSTTELRRRTISCGYSDPSIRTEEIIKFAARNLAEELIEKGFIKSRICSGYVEFYIDVYE